MHPKYLVAQRRSQVKIQTSSLEMHGQLNNSLSLRISKDEMHLIKFKCNRIFCKKRQDNVRQHVMIKQKKITKSQTGDS